MPSDEQVVLDGPVDPTVGDTRRANFQAGIDMQFRNTARQFHAAILIASSNGDMAPELKADLYTQLIQMASAVQEDVK